jgi:zinc protease
LHLGHLGVERLDPDFEELVVLDHVLGSGPGLSSRIAHRLRDELGLAYTVHASITSSAGMLPGTFSAYIGTSPEHVRTAVAGFLEELHRIRREPVTADELELAKSYLQGALALSFERSSQRVGYLIQAHRFGFGPGHLEHLLERYRGVTAADLLRVARAHLHPDAACLAGGGPVTKRELELALEGAKPRGKKRAKKRTARR